MRGPTWKTSFAGESGSNLDFQSSPLWPLLGAVGDLWPVGWDDPEPLEKKADQGCTGCNVEAWLAGNTSFFLPVSSLSPATFTTQRPAESLSKVQGA